jgi:hypothetical protein
MQTNNMAEGVSVKSSNNTSKGVFASNYFSKSSTPFSLTVKRISE